MMRPPRPGSAKPRVGAPVCRRSYAAASPPQRRIMAPLCVRSPPATAREDAVRVWGFTRWGFRAQRRAGTERGSVPLALPGRGCVLGDAGNDRAEHRRRSLSLPPLAARPPAGAGRVGRPSTSSGLRGRRSRRAVFAGKARAPCSPVVFVEGEPPRPVPLAGRFKLAAACAACEDARVFAVLSFKRPAFTLPPKLALRLRAHPPRQPPRTSFALSCRGSAPAPGTPGNLSCRVRGAPPFARRRRSAFSRRRPEEVGSAAEKKR